MNFLVLYSVKANESLLYEQYLLSKKTWESLIAYGIKTKEFNEVNAEAIIDIIIFSYQGVRLYSNLMLYKSSNTRKHLVYYKKYSFKIIWKGCVEYGYYYFSEIL